MATLVNNIRHRRGDTFTTKTYALLTCHGDPVDLTAGWQIRAQARGWDGALIHTWEGDEVFAGLALIEPAGGGPSFNTATVRLESPPSATTTWPVTVARWDIQITKGDEAHTIVTGTLRITKDVTAT